MTTDYPLLLDEMLSGEIASQLRAKGHDVIAVVEDPTLIGTPDEELLVHSTSSGRCLVTANVGDFSAINTSWGSQRRDHAGLMYIVNRAFPNDRSFIGAIVTALDDAISTSQIPTAGAETYLRRHLE